MTVKHPLNWYEASLPMHERKLRGHFSTPPPLVEHILDACAYTPDRDLSALRVLDPACGSGNFLIGAARRLLTSVLRQTTLPPGKAARQALRVMQRNLWGLDPDSVACCLAQLGLHEVTAALLGQQRVYPPFHIHQADGLALPWENCETVDLFLANPPYLATKNGMLSGYRSALRRGQVDSYLLFLQLALQVVRPGGWLALVLPDPLLARINATEERRRLLAETSVQHLWHLASVFEAQVGAVVLIAQKRPPEPHHHILWIRQRWSVEQQQFPGEQTVSQSLLAGQPHAELRYLLGQPTDILPIRLHSYLCHIPLEQDTCLFEPLERLVAVHRGEELGKNHSALLSERPAETTEEHYTVLRGGCDLRPYALMLSQCWLARHQIIKPLQRYQGPKLLVVKSTPYLQGALDTQQHVVLQTLYLLTLHNAGPPTARDQAGDQTSTDEMDTLYFLLALLNSRLLRDYVYILYTAYKWVQPQIEQHVLRQLPIPRAELIDARSRREIIERARALEQQARAWRHCQGDKDIADGDMITTGEKRENADRVLCVPPYCYHQHVYQSLYEQQERVIRALYTKILQQTEQIDKGVVYYG